MRENTDFLKGVYIANYIFATVAVPCIVFWIQIILSLDCMKDYFITLDMLDGNQKNVFIIMAIMSTIQTLSLILLIFNPR